MRGLAFIGCVCLAWACGGETDSGSSTGGSSSGAKGGTASGGKGGSGGTTGGTGAVAAGGTVATGGVAGFGGGVAGAPSGGTGGIPIGCPTEPPKAGDQCMMGAALCVYSCVDCFCPAGTWECKNHECFAKCSQPALWCTTPGNQCQCWGGKWTCEGTSLDPATLPEYVSTGQPCTAQPELVCYPNGSNGAGCKCESGKWDCAPDAGKNLSCPASFDTGQACSAPGMLCIKNQWCPPWCVCQLDGTFDCTLFTPC